MESLDAIVGFAVVMLGTSLMITVLVQGISSLFNLRGSALVAGLVELFTHAGMTEQESRATVRKILGHPLITESALPSWPMLERWRLATAIRKTELVRLLSEPEAARTIASGEVQQRAERALAVVEDWFDSQMDRVSQVFAQRARLITMCVSFVVAFGLHLDAVHLMERLHSDAELRAGLVASASSLEQRAEQLMGTSSEAGDQEAQRSLGQAVLEARSLRTDLRAAHFELLPRFGPHADLEAGVHAPFDFVPNQGAAAWRHFLGISAFGVLLSLGAPFWFNALKTLVNLRSVLANKEARERKQGGGDGAVGG